jgi:hypothetical protein
MEARMRTIARILPWLLLASPALAQSPPPPPPTNPPAADSPSPFATPPEAAAPAGAPASTPAPSTAGDAVATHELAPPHDRGAVIIGLKAGGTFSEPFSPLGPSYLVGVELGYLLPFAHRSIAILVDGAFTEPGASGGTTDPRVTSNGGAYTWNLTQREVLIGLTLMYRLHIGTGRVAPYIGVGPRVWLLQSKLVGEAGAGNPISESNEQSTKFGVSAPLGVDIGLGPGRLFIEAQVMWAPIDHRSTGDSSVGAINGALGYRLLL